jgi:drug/metabolite transporter (DMT)-like permease
VSWITYFYSLKYLDPALALMVSVGVGPITADLAERRDHAPVGGRNIERTLHLCIVACIGVGVLMRIVDPSSTKDPGTVLLGAWMGLVSGVTLAIYRISCKRLNDKGVAAGTILGVRSPVIAFAATAVAWATSDTDVGAWSATSLATVSAACIALIVIPIYVNQVGVALASPITAGVATALQPTLLLGMQVLLSMQQSHSAYSLGAVLLYSVFAISSTLVRQTGSPDQQPTIANARAATA